MKMPPQVLGPRELSNSFLGSLIQVCVVTRDFRRTMAGFVQLGIGPWTVRTVDASNCKAVYRGRPADFEVKLCLANSQNMNWEIIQPIRGASIYEEFLEHHGEGVQHLAFSCSGMEYEERIRQFQERGYEMTQYGVIFGGVEFHYFSAEADLRTTMEIYRVPPDFEFPAPDEWYPTPPP